jgi:hypothetical protein
MSLSACMQAQGLAATLRNGLQALGPNSARVTMTPGSQAVHSVDLDDALRQQYPRAPRWDYGVQWRRGQSHQIAWVEVHPATSGEVAAFLRKLGWLRAWLQQAAAQCEVLPASFHWVATDAGVHIDSARRRRLNAAGIRMPRGRLEL